MKPPEARRFMHAVLSAKVAAGDLSSTVDDRSWLTPLAQGRRRGESDSWECIDHATRQVRVQAGADSDDDSD